MFTSTDEKERGKYEHLGQNLLGPAPGEVLPTTAAVPMIEVVAPATLTEGYQFEAKVGERSFSVTVPTGGVEAGQKFTVPFSGGSSDTFTQQMVIPKLTVPVGAWKDGICGCCAYGPCHTHLWMSCCCPLIGIAQVISRLQLNFWGKPGSVGDAASAFKFLSTVVLSYIGLYFLLSVILSDASPKDQDLPIYIYVVFVLRDCLHWIYVGFTMFILYNVRSYVRDKYAIPENEPKTGVEDILCSVCCHSLATAQLMRHTTDYDTYNATCISETGLPHHVPAIV